MYCRNCGAPLADNAVVCARCGATVTPPAPPPGTQQPYQSQQQPYHPPYYQYPYGQQPYPQQEDRPSAGFHVLAFFFPIVGLILYLVWKDQKPRCAHAIGKWALIGFIANTILIIIGIVFSLLLYSVAAPSYYDFRSYNDIVYGISMAIRMIAR